MNVQWQGVFPAVTTKFTEYDELDLWWFNKNITAQLEAGVNGIILGGTLGEASTLNDREKFELIRHTVEVVSDRVPVVINIAEQSTNTAIQAIKRAEDAGASGLMILPPMRYRATDAETLRYLKTLARNTNLPIMIYNNPVDYNIEVSLDMFDELAEEDNVQAVKESTRDVSNVTRMLNRFGDRFKILSGVDTLALESLKMGAHGWVAGLVCAFPRETVAIYNLHKAGLDKEATEIYRWFLPLLELDITPQLVQNIKLAESLVGLGTEYVRLPRMPLSGTERERVKTIIDEAILTRPLLPDHQERFNTANAL